MKNLPLTTILSSVQIPYPENDNQIKIINSKSNLLTQEGINLIQEALLVKWFSLELLMRGSDHGFTKE